MSSPSSISIQKFARLVGTPKCPAVIDVRADVDFGEPQAAGLLAASLGLSRMYSDDLKQLDAGMTLYDALYLWCRDATTEVHTWPSNRPSRTP